MVHEIEIYRFTGVYSLLTKKVSDYKKLQFWKFCSYSFPCRSCTAAWSSWKRVCKRMRCSVGRVPFLPTTSLGWTSSSGPLSPSRRCVFHYRQKKSCTGRIFLDNGIFSCEEAALEVPKYVHLCVIRLKLDLAFNNVKPKEKSFVFD